MDSLWVSWEDHRRSRELAAHFGAELKVLESPAARPVRYLVLTWRTFLLLLRTRPRLLFCQNPSVVLAVWLSWWRPAFGYHLVVDRHSNFKFDTVDRPGLKWRVFHALSDYTLRRADLTIVTNQALCDIVVSRGGRGFVLQDKLPDLAPRNPVAANGRRSIVFVCTFADDEPVAAVLDAARVLGPDYRLLVTGNRARFDRDFGLPVPDNVELTGFLPEQEYIDLLAGADAILVLTSADYVLNCASYEAVALGRPMVLTDTPTIRGYFGKGACYVQLDPAGIAAGVSALFSDYERYRIEVGQLRGELMADWAQRAAAFRSLIAVDAGARP